MLSPYICKDLACELGSVFGQLDLLGMSKTFSKESLIEYNGWGGVSFREGEDGKILSKNSIFKSS